MADRWGRKKTITLGALFFFLHWIVMLQAESFWFFVVAVSFYAFSYACFSGTDDALLYDTKKELKEEGQTLGSFGKLYSAKSIFKIVTPILGAVVAQDLVEWQFQALIVVDIIASMGALLSALALTEAEHYKEVENEEADILMQSWNILSSNKKLLRVMLNKTLIFIASFIVWNYYQKFFVDLGMAVIAIGVGWSIVQLLVFILSQRITKIFKGKLLAERISIINLVFVSSIGLFLIVFFYNPNYFYTLFVIFMIFQILDRLRNPLFAELFNKNILSYNRSTTLSLTNFLKSILDIPILLLGSWLVELNMIYPYFIALGVGIIVLLFISLRGLNLKNSQANTT